MTEFRRVLFRSEIKECKYECNICNKKYNGQSGLWKHKQRCKESPSEIKTEEYKQELNELKALIIEMTNNKKTLIKDDNDNSRNEIMENVLENVKI